MIDTSLLAERLASLTPDQREAIQRSMLPRLPEAYIRHIPHPKQQVFLNLMCKEALYGGAAGGGKSDAILMGALQYVDVPGYSALILRRTWPDLNAAGAILDRAKQWLKPTDAIARDGGRQFVFPSGARVSFGYLQHEDDKYKFQCLTEDTDVLTGSGWKPAKDVSITDTVASVDPVSRVMSYETVSRKFVYDFDGEIVSAYSKHGPSFRVTPNHTVWASTEKQRVMYGKQTLAPYRADELPATACIPQVFDDYVGVDPALPDVGRHKWTTEGWVNFLGWYIAEGNAQLDGDIKVSQVKERGRVVIERDAMPYEGYWASTSTYYRISNVRLARWIHENIGRYSKLLSIPEEVWGWDRKWATMLLDAMVAGDGTVYRELRNSSGNGRAQCTYVTYSKQLADDVMRLAVHCGWRPTLDIRTTDTENGNCNSGTEYYRICMSKRDRDTSTKTQTERFVGKVYCVETPRFNTLVIRHRGRVSLTGNSAEYQYIGFDELTHFEESQYSYVFSRLRRPALVCVNCNEQVTKRNGRYRHRKLMKGKCIGLFPDPKVIEQYPEAMDGMSIFDVPLRMRGATNPGGRGNEWVKRYFVNAESREKGAVFVPASLRDNPSLDRKSYEESLSHLSEVDKANLKDGNWDVSESGDFFERAWFKLIERPLPDTTGVRKCRFWDMASSEGKGDYTAGALVVAHPDGRVEIRDLVRGQWGSAKGEAIVRQTAQADGSSVPIRMEQEPGSSGVNIISHFRRNVVPGYNFDGIRPTGSKPDRAYPWKVAAEKGLIHVVVNSFTTQFLNEAEAFPLGAHDDMIDAISGGWSHVYFDKRRSRLVV